LKQVDIYRREVKEHWGIQDKPHVWEKRLNPLRGGGRKKERASRLRGRNSELKLIHWGTKIGKSKENKQMNWGKKGTTEEAVIDKEGRKGHPFPWLKKKNKKRRKDHLFLMGRKKKRGGMDFIQKRTG